MTDSDWKREAGSQATGETDIMEFARCRRRIRCGNGSRREVADAQRFSTTCILAHYSDYVRVTYPAALRVLIGLEVDAPIPGSMVTEARRNVQ